MGYKYQDPQRTGSTTRTAPTGKIMSPQQVAALIQKQKKTIDELQAQLKEKTARINALTAANKRHQKTNQAEPATSERVASLEKELADVTERLLSSENRAGELTERIGVQSAAYADLKVSFDNERTINQSLTAKLNASETNASNATEQVKMANAANTKLQAEKATLVSKVHRLEKKLEREAGGNVIFEGVLDASGLERVKGACL
ncbi:hypothetical protein ACIP5Z_01565 [Rothia terrae]|uniref:hypothetical protein n=1 Tax=Rothia terrae TaxID=396015 RepID=UPI0038081617